MPLPTHPGVSQKLHGLDHLRTLAITYVFLFHYFILSKGEPAWLPPVAAFGWTGVDLFFVLSGFLIAAQLFAESKSGQGFSLKTFFIRRSLRILPAFGVTLALYFCFPFFREKESLPPLWKFLTFIQNIGLNLKDQGTFSHCWSLCVEEHFYLFFPLVLVLLYRLRLFRRSWWLLLALFLAGFIIRVYSYREYYLPQSSTEISWMYWYQYIYYPSWNRLDGLLAGVGLAALYHFAPGAWSRISRYGNLMLVAGPAILVAAWFLCEDQMTFSASVYGYPLIALGYGLLVAGAVSPGSLLYRLKSGLSSRIATLSYAVYLTHKGLIHMTHDLLAGQQINSNLLLVISILACLCFAGLMHRLVEQPFLRLRKRLLPSREKLQTGSAVIPPA
ncbi:acyltransferase family protein [Taibaiella chishuiensis]|uniref:Peptidoglycan/LPS O-acetylase OafA/YrhL n=1 Tax=Taibaiella chishuiensis TaxID=1434707 RepID=A0A2P8CXS8_9BACT|nr:acyltransferase [Taibaiella chishuiensis]PSK89781.1 peptidoglycan/LPS O-acetylase OafA/YrhL [Taibaiella chishuiensis]